jgi:hypothetical protein
MWSMAGISLILISIPFIAAALDGVLDSLLSQGYWYHLLQAPVVILYILFVSPWMAKSDADMLKAFRPLLMIDEDHYDRLVREASRVNPIGEVIAAMIGALLGLGLSLTWLMITNTFWLRLYLPIAQGFMFGLLGWTIYNAFASTRLIKALHQQPLHIDILDIRPFEPMGRHALVTSLVFMGGVTLGMLFGVDIDNLLAWQTWLTILPFLAVPVVIFFLSMGYTHRVLALEKNRELQALGQRIQRVSAILRSHLTQDEDLGKIAVEYSALAAYETRLRAASTWPYNIGMLRTLAFTIIVPLIVRGLSAWLFGQ